MLTDMQCKNATCPADKKRARFTDSAGLYLDLSPTGSKRWFWKMYVDGKEGRMALGSYPAASLADARKARNSAKRQKADGHNSVQVRKTTKLLAVNPAGDTFKTVALEWYERQSGRFRPGRCWVSRSTTCVGLGRRTEFRFGASVHRRRCGQDTWPIRRIGGERVDLILALGNTQIAAACVATATIPIGMMYANNPVQAGFVASLGCAGGNVTGLAASDAEINAKQWQLLRDAVPGARRIGWLIETGMPGFQVDSQIVQRAAIE